MRKVLRDKDHYSYWNNRWSTESLDEDYFTNESIYPIKYILPYIFKEMKFLEVGCGLGRILMHLHNQNYEVYGFDYSLIAIQRVKIKNNMIPVVVANVSELPYKKEQFDIITAFGVFHSIEDIEIIKKGIKSIYGILKKKGIFIVSVRIDNLENRFIDYITMRRGSIGNKFHKWCFKKYEFLEYLIKNNLKIVSIETTTNYPFLYKYKIFRGKKRKKINNRSQGYQLNSIGSMIYKLLKFVFPDQFGTTVIYTIKKEV